MIKYSDCRSNNPDIADKLNGVGKKIKFLRKRMKMTQDQLAGEIVTRNMLSRIENGTALPSLPTLIHIADSLCVPVSALLDDDFLDNHLRSQAISKAREHIKNGDYAEALNAIKNDYIIADDEASLIIIECELALAKKYAGERKYFDASQSLSNATKQAENTIYSTSGSAYIASLYHSLASYMLPQTSEKSIYSTPKFDKYIDLYIYLRLTDLFERGQIVKAINLALLCEINDRILSTHIAAKLDMANGRYSEAETKLKQIIESEKVTPSAHGSLMLYRIYGELEQCAKGQNDYVLAYNYREEKLKLYTLMSGIKL